MRHIIYGFLLLLSFSSIAMAQPKAKQIWLDGKVVASLQKALKQANHKSIIKLGSGTFKQAGVINKNGITIEGSNGTKMLGKTVHGKATFVIKGNNTTIKNIECSNINVKDGNGACVRLEGKNLKLQNVYFHDSQQGLLTGGSPGYIKIFDSKFERLGKAGMAHGIYVGGGTLIIKNSTFLSSKDQGHEIKSRATETRIENSVIASLDGNDSRLVDIPNGGKLVITDSLLGQGPKSVNWNLIGFGHEKYWYPENSITLIGNIFLLERDKGNLVLDVKDNKAKLNITQNAFIGRINEGDFDDTNFYFEDRESAGLEAYPTLPDITK